MYITGRIAMGNKIVGYIVVDDSGKQSRIKRHDVIELASRKLLDNARVQKYTPKETGVEVTILRGKGINLNELPAYDISELSVNSRSSENDGLKEPNIKPYNAKEIIKRYTDKAKMVEGDPVFGFVTDLDGNIYINKYYDRPYRKEVVIPEFVYGFVNCRDRDEITGAFNDCEYLEKIIGTSKLHGGMRQLFFNFDGEKLILENFDTEYITDMTAMFCCCGEGRMEELRLGDKFNTINVKNMSMMFKSCGTEVLQVLDLGNNFNTVNVENMQSMFYECGYCEMTSLRLGNKFNTINVSNMSEMFSNCGRTRLKKLDLGDKFDTRNVIDMRGMFYKCGTDKMEEIRLGDKFYTSKVKRMDWMFGECGKMWMGEIDLGCHFDVASGTMKQGMFIGIEDKEIYLKGECIDPRKFQQD